MYANEVDTKEKQDKKLTTTYVLLYSLMITERGSYRILGGKSGTFQKLR